MTVDRAWTLFVRQWRDIMTRRWVDSVHHGPPTDGSGW